MKIFFLFLVASTAVLAAPVDKKTEELINAAMVYNFDACILLIVSEMKVIKKEKAEVQ